MNAKEMSCAVPMNAPSHILVTLSGSMISSSPEFANISSGIAVILLPSSKDTAGTELPRKMALPRFSTDAGIITSTQIAVFSKADCSMVFRLEFSANIISSTGQSAKA